MWADVCAEERVCREVDVHRCAGAVHGCTPDPGYVLVPPSSSLLTHVTSMLLSLSLWEKLSQRLLGFCTNGV